MNDDIEADLRALQDAFADIDLLARLANASAYEFLVKRYQNIVVRMDGNKNHKRAHLHIDYGPQRHVASYAIDSGERLAGDLSGKYDRVVHEWIARNREKLMIAWNMTQSGEKPDAIIAELGTSKMG